MAGGTLSAHRASRVGSTPRSVTTSAPRLTASMMRHLQPHAGASRLCQRAEAHRIHSAAHVHHTRAHVMESEGLLWLPHC